MRNTIAWSGLAGCCTCLVGAIFYAAGIDSGLWIMLGGSFVWLVASIALQP